jgi:hypothetical protein
MALEDKEFDVTITVAVKRTEEISTGKAVTDFRHYTITDRYTAGELRVLISELTPPAETTI